MELTINPKYPSVDDLRKRAMVKMPKFAFEYLDGGCNEDVNLNKNRTDLQKIELFVAYPLFLYFYFESQILEP